MKDFTKNVQFLNKMIAKMQELNIDLYVIITAEGADPIPLRCFGVDTVGASAYVFSKDGAKLALASVIDAQDVEESGMFDEVRRYSSFYPDLAAMAKEHPHKTIAFDYSEDIPLCDGLSMGKYTQFTQALGEGDFAMVSSDRFIPEVMKETL